jgi:transposase
MDGAANAGCIGCRELEVQLQAQVQRIAQLEAQLAERDRRIEELVRKFEESQRQSKRQAAPFSKGKPKPDPQKPGRKPGDGGKHAHRTIPTPDQVDETLEANLPDACPHCQGHIVESTADLEEQFQTEIPRRPIVRKFNIHVGWCACCKRRIQGRHPLQTSDALGAAASQIGPDAQAAAALLNKQAGLSHGKIVTVFDALFGIKLSRGASAQINLRAADRLEPDYQLILNSIRDSKQIAADETGWRLGGHSAWLHVWVGGEATAYAIDSQRSANALERVIGIDWTGILSHDGYATYERFDQALHQQCVAHVLRRAQNLLDVAVGGAVHFPKQVLTLFRESVHLRNVYLEGAVTLDQLQAQRDAFDDRLLALVRRPRAVAAHTTFANFLWNHFEQWFTFLFNPQVEATNWQAEQAVRPAVVNRKVWGGNRTPAGGEAQGILMSVIETCRRHARSAVDHVSETLRAVGNRFLPRPQLLPGR